MDTPTRRGVLAAMGIAATAGCSGLAKQVPAVGDDSSIRGEKIKSVTESFALSKGQFRPYKLTFDSRSVLLYSVVADAKIDVLLFRRPDFKKYKKDAAKELPYVAALSDLDTRATARGSDVTSGRPVLVVDNTTWGEASPSGEVQVEVELEAFVRAENA